MLEFVLLEVGSLEEAKDLFFFLLTKNSHLAGLLYKWLNENRPELSGDWENKFKNRYADATLEQIS